MINNEIGKIKVKYETLYGRLCAPTRLLSDREEIRLIEVIYPVAGYNIPLQRFPLLMQTSQRFNYFCFVISSR